MKEFLRESLSFSKNFALSLVSFFSIIFFSTLSARRSIKRIRKSIKNKDKALILANGPSLNTYLEKGDYPLGGVFVVNFFSVSPYFKQLRPDNYIVADPRMCGEATGAFAEEVAKVYKNINEADWDINMFFPSYIPKKVVNKMIKNPHIHVVYYNRTSVEGFKWFRHFIYRNNLGMPTPENVTNASIFLALNLGYKNIYLYGLEHSWMKNFDCDPVEHKIFLNDGHFYESKNLRYFKRGEYDRWLEEIHIAMSSHYKLREYADLIGTKIVNKTDYSFVDAYEFEDY